jgi:hypothetical protein
MNGERGEIDGNFNEEGQNSICGTRDEGYCGCKSPNNTPKLVNFIFAGQIN